MTNRLFMPGTLVLVISLLFFAPAVASAQATTVGVKGGINLANIDLRGGDVTFSFDRRLGGVGGLFVAHDFNDNVGLLLEALYSQHGTQANDLLGPGQDLKVRANYFVVPVLARANVVAPNDVTVHLFGGPAFAAKIDDTQKIGDETLTGEDELKLKAYDVGLSIGAGLTIKRFVADARYTWGMINIAEETEGDATVKSRTFTVMVGFRFN